MIRKTYVLLNPKDVSEISDRAKRYRANAHPPDPPKQCGFCGSKRNVGVGHLDGNEDHGEPENLMWTCKRCNAVQVNLLKSVGLGKRVQQMKPETWARFRTDGRIRGRNQSDARRIRR